METINLKLYSTGEYFTPYLRDIITEGRWKPAYDFLVAGGATESLIKKFFMFEAEFVGDTRDNSFALRACDQVVGVSEALLTGLRTILAQYNDERERNSNYNYMLFELEHYSKKIPDLECLFKVIPEQEVLQAIWKDLLKGVGYYVADPKSYHSKTDSVSGHHLSTGVIIPTGEYILCNYMGHHELFGYLAMLGFASDSKWTDDDKCIHVSSGSIHGNVANVLRDPELYVGHYRDREDKTEVTDTQLDTLFALREHIYNIYGDYGDYDTKLVNQIRKYIVAKENQGGKYGNLAFLHRYYPTIKLPEFSTVMSDLKYEKVFMRTSPDKSLPGLLNSRLMNNTEHDFNLMKNFIQYEFEKVKDLRSDNSLHWFFQQYIDGLNGVAHYYSKSDFEHAVSEKRGDIVKGIEGHVSLDHAQYNRLRAIASMLWHDLKDPLQLEFAANTETGEIYIVQLRMLENNPEVTVIAGKPKTAFHQGITFSKGTINRVAIKDILIVESEADSKELLGKKALIVKGNPSFSHILALSKALKIPSMYATGEIDFGGREEVRFYAYNKEAFICEPQND